MDFIFAANILSVLDNFGRFWGERPKPFKGVCVVWIIEQPKV